MSTSRPKEAPKMVEPDALIHPTTILTGNHKIIIGSKVVIQPHTLLDSSNGPIIIGAHTVIAERCIIGSTAEPAQDGFLLEIGQGAIIETGVTIRAGTAIGDFAIVSVQAKVGKGAKVGANCKIGQGVTVRDGEAISDNTVVWGDRWDERRTENEAGGLRVGGGREGLAKGLGDGLRAVWSNK